MDEAKAYLLELVNRDRASLKLKPVELDDVASAMAQTHADEMASEGYMAHWDRKGRGPTQRYTEHGGRDFVQENAYLLRDGGGLSDPIQLNDNPTFSRSEIEGIEAAYFNQRPPGDSHRKNISRTDHTHVGIGLARAGSDFGPSRLANCQEFVNKYIELDELPKEAKPGEKIRISGLLGKGMEINNIAIAREPTPQAMSVSQLQSMGSYGTPSAFVIYRTESANGTKQIVVKPDGRFYLEATLSDENQAGLYYVTIKVIDSEGRQVTASQRTIIVK